MKAAIRSWKIGRGRAVSVSCEMIPFLGVGWLKILDYGQSGVAGRIDTQRSILK